MPQGYGTVNMRKQFIVDLVALAAKVAEKEGLSKVSLQGLIERMKKVYEENVEL